MLVLLLLLQTWCRRLPPSLGREFLRGNTGLTVVPGLKVGAIKLNICAHTHTFIYFFVGISLCLHMQYFIHMGLCDGVYVLISGGIYTYVLIYMCSYEYLQVPHFGRCRFVQYSGLCARGCGTVQLARSYLMYVRVHMHMHVHVYLHLYSKDRFSCWFRVDISLNTSVLILRFLLLHTKAYACISCMYTKTISYIST